jgi:hypothetical protein
MVHLWLQRVDSGLEARWNQLRADECAPFREDYLDLNRVPATDFLAVNTCYDLVVTHNLWGFPELSGPADSPARTGPTACSPLHGIGAWRRRLAGCGARYIFMFGPHFNASYLGRSLRGYRCFEVGTSGGLDVFVSRAAEIASDAPQRPITYRDKNAARLRHLGELSLNQALDLSYTALESAHVDQVAAMPDLQDLRLAGTAVTDADLARLAGCACLRKLDLDDTTVGTGGMSHLARLAGLECLSLNHTKVDDDGLGHLQALTRLEWLALVGTPVSDRGLAQLRSLDSLHYLSIVDTRATSAGTDRLRRALPSCTIHSADREVGP